MSEMSFDPGLSGIEGMRHVSDPELTLDSTVSHAGGGEASLVDALAQQPGALGYDLDGDGTVDTVALDLGGTGHIDYVEHLESDGSGVSVYDGDGDGRPDIVGSESGGNGGYDSLTLTGDVAAAGNPLLATFTFEPPEADAQRADFGEPHFGGTAISGGSAVEAKPSDELIVAADGSGYDGVSDYVKGKDPYEPLS